MFLMFGHTVKFKAPGMLFFRRLHRVAEVYQVNTGYGFLWVARCKTGALAYIPPAAAIVIGKNVKVDLNGEGV